MSVPHYLTRRGFESALSERGHYMDDLYYVAMYAAEKLLDKYKALSEKGERKEKELGKAVDEDDRMVIGYLEFEIDEIADDIQSVEAELGELMNIIDGLEAEQIWVNKRS